MLFVRCSGVGSGIGGSPPLTIDGVVVSTQDSADTVVGWETASTTDTITFTSSTKMGAAIGTWVTLRDIAADQWTVGGQGTSTGTEATPFSGS